MAEGGPLGLLRVSSGMVFRTVRPFLSHGSLWISKSIFFFLCQSSRTLGSTRSLPRSSGSLAGSLPTPFPSCWFNPVASAAAVFLVPDSSSTLGLFGLSLQHPIPLPLSRYRSLPGSHLLILPSIRTSGSWASVCFHVSLPTWTHVLPKGKNCTVSSLMPKVCVFSTRDPISSRHTEAASTSTRHAIFCSQMVAWACSASQGEGKPFLTSDKCLLS